MTSPALSEERIAAETEYRIALRNADCWARVIALTALEDVTPSERTKQRLRDALEAEQTAYRRMAAAQRAAS